MRELLEIGARLYLTCATLAQISAVMIGFAGFVCGFLANSMVDRELAGLSPWQFFMIGFLGPIAMFALSAACVAAANLVIDGKE